jgi:hypothetical protein
MYGQLAKTVMNVWTTGKDSNECTDNRQRLQYIQLILQLTLVEYRNNDISMNFIFI